MPWGEGYHARAPQALCPTTSTTYTPDLRSVDEAIRRRLHLVPFSVTIPPEERDLQFAEKLRAEWPGILACVGTYRAMSRARCRKSFVSRSTISSQN